MFSFLKKLFGFFSPKDHASARSIKHRKNLKEGDLVKFSYLPLEDVSNKTFEVIQCNHYLYAGVEYPEWILRDDTKNIIYMMVEEEDGEKFIALCKKISKDLVPNYMNNTINIQEFPSEYEGWLTNTYKIDDRNLKGFFLKGTTKEPFISHVFIDSTDEKAIEIEVYASNEVDICATTYHDLSIIEEMWPRYEQA